MTCVFFQISFEINQQQLLFLVLSGIVGLVLGDTFFFKSLKEVGPRYTMIIMSSNPAFGAVIAYFTFKETISFTGILGMIITLVGICLVVYQQNGNEVTKYKITKKGIIWGFLSSLCQASGLIFTKSAFLMQEIHPLSASFYRVFPSFLILTIFGLATNKINVSSLKSILNRKTFTLILFGSIMGPFIGISLSFVAVTNIQVGIAATIMSLQPIIMLPISKYIQKEKFSTQSIAGAFLAVLGISLLFSRGNLL